MKPEILENLLYYYIEEKTGYDAVDSPVPRSRDFVSTEFDNPFQFSSILEESYANLPEVPPHSPVVFIHEPLDSVQRVQVVEAGKKLAKLTDEFAAGHPEKCPVAFKSSCMFLPCKKQSISIAVVRTLGSSNEPLKISWKTHDRTAIAGTHYASSAGELDFGKSVMEKDIQIDILSFNTNADDLRFKIELSVENSVFVPLPITLILENINGLNQEEKSFKENLLSSSPSSASEVTYILKDCLTDSTFHSALSYVCSKADSLPLEIGLAFELSRLCLDRLPYKSIFAILQTFFRMDDLEF